MHLDTWTIINIALMLAFAALFILSTMKQSYSKGFSDGISYGRNSEKLDTIKQSVTSMERELSEMKGSSNEA